MKTLADRSQNDYRDHRSLDMGWQEQASRQRTEQQRAYHNQENKDLVQRLIAKVSTL